MAERHEKAPLQRFPWRPVHVVTTSVNGALQKWCSYGRRPTTSSLPPVTDIVTVGRHVSKVPIPAVSKCIKVRHSSLDRGAARPHRSDRP
jgi:hypothetical protein